jgi:hypothetical protein
MYQEILRSTLVKGITASTAKAMLVPPHANAARKSKVHANHDSRIGTGSLSIRFGNGAPLHGAAEDSILHAC